MKRVLMAIIIVGMFMFAGSVKAAELPQTVCDDAQSAASHLLPEATKEEGGRLFAYGSGGIEINKYDWELKGGVYGE